MSEKVEKARAAVESWRPDCNRNNYRLIRFRHAVAALESAIREEALEEALALATWPADYEAIRALKEKR